MPQCPVWDPEGFLESHRPSGHNERLKGAGINISKTPETTDRWEDGQTAAAPFFPWLLYV